VTRIDHADLASLGPHVLVPTMGALHDGHRALIRLAGDIASRRGLSGGCVVTVFVNPTQFNERDDYDRYPRTLDADIRASIESGASAVYAPSPEQVYPPGAEPAVPRLPRVATAPLLEDRFRPGHFAGVCQVVHRLFALTRPACAIFGEKDYQQLQVIRAMTADLGLAVEIIPGPTIRDRDGLAMSSRNGRLAPEQRPAALSLSAALCAAQSATDPLEAESIMVETMRREGAIPEYAAIRDAETLEPNPPANATHGPLRALVAARVGSTRLLDNAPWTSRTAQ